MHIKNKIEQDKTLQTMVHFDFIRNVEFKEQTLAQTNSTDTNVHVTSYCAIEFMVMDPP